METSIKILFSEVLLIRVTSAQFNCLIKRKKGYCEDLNCAGHFLVLSLFAGLAIFYHIAHIKTQRT